MKAFLGLILLVSIAITLSFEEDPSKQHGVNGWYIPQVNGSFIWMNKEEAEHLLEKLANSIGKSDLSFHLYTKSNPTYSQQISATTESISNSYFNPNNPTRFVIHGWRQDHESDSIKLIREAWLTQGEFNVFVLHWQGARNLYSGSVAHVPGVGKQLAELIDLLHTGHDMALETLILIGFSLGAHIAGYAGKNVKSGKINTIYGLDSAWPFFSYNNPSERLCDTDATYVESIHTNGYRLGFLKPIGKVSFYPNGGKRQPGCLLPMCSHSRAPIYYAEAVQRNNFLTIKCDDYSSAISDTCGHTYSNVRMASGNNFKIASGSYYVLVNKKPPFGQGV